MSTAARFRVQSFDVAGKNATSRSLLVDVYLDNQFLAQRYFFFETPLDSDLVPTRQLTRALRSLAYELDQIDKK